MKTFTVSQVGEKFLCLVKTYQFDNVRQEWYWATKKHESKIFASKEKAEKYGKEITNV